MVHIPAEQVFIMMFGGAEVDGDGIGILPGGGIVHIPPRSPEFTAMVRALSALAPIAGRAEVADAVASLATAVHIEAVQGLQARE
jgi:hypothetical protein